MFRPTTQRFKLRLRPTAEAQAPGPLKPCTRRAWLGFPGLAWAGFGLKAQAGTSLAIMML